MSKSVIVQANSRLHFGLMGGENPGGTSFGGIGAMVDRPGMRIRLSETGERSFLGQQSDRIRQFTEDWLRFTRFQPPNEFTIELLHSPPSHIGLGTGTQLGLSVAAGLYKFFLEELPSVEVLAKSVKRGLRSAIGAYGFQEGGFIVDHGKLAGESLSRVEASILIPSEWRFVLLQVDSETGISGHRENRVFSSHEIDRNSRREQLAELIETQICPNLWRGSLTGFGEGLYQYGRIAGSCFADQQGGDFNGPRMTEMVQYIRGLGVAGVGQSSWGPTLFAVVGSAEDANQLVGSLSDMLRDNESVSIAGPANQGAEVVMEPTHGQARDRENRYSQLNR